MAETAPRPPDTALPLAGAIIAASGLLAAAALLGVLELPALLTLSEVGLAVGVLVLLLGRTGIVGPSWAGRGALLLLGLGPLVFRLEPAPAAISVLVGTVTMSVVTIATVVSAVLVAWTGRVHGVARWALLVVAADALLVAVMSTVPTEGLVLLYLGLHLELVRPLTLLVWGIALLLQSEAVRRSGAAAIASWRRTTDVGGSSHETLVAPEPDRNAARNRAG